MQDITKSEAFVALTELFGEYKKFCFSVISRVPYSSVSRWTAFTDGKPEVALQEKRDIAQNIKDKYVIMVLGFVFSCIAFWYGLILVGMFGSLIATLIAAAMVVNAQGTALIVAGIVVIMLLAIIIGPPLVLLARTAIYYAVARLLGGKASYTETMDVLVMTDASGIILMIPMYIAYAVVIGFFMSPLAYVIRIFELYLRYKGIKQVNGFTSQKLAIAATLGPWVIEFVLLVGIIVLTYLAIMLGLGGATAAYRHGF